jgi:hypothetical protein
MQKRRYEILLPLTLNDGKPIKPELFDLTRDELLDRFGGLTHSPHPRSGYWIDKGQRYEDGLILYVVDVDDTPENQEFFTFYKPTLLERFEQIEIYIISYPIERV